METQQKIPRRYGKQQIEKDIISQGGIATEIQKTMLALNELKSLYINLQGKGRSDHYKGTSKISDDDGIIIRSAIKEFKYRVKHISHPSINQNKLNNYGQK